jgi:hypothetical protein
MGVVNLAGSLKILYSCSRYIDLHELTGLAGLK